MERSVQNIGLNLSDHDFAFGLSLINLFCGEKCFLKYKQIWVPQEQLILNHLSRKSCKEWRSGLTREQNCSLKQHTPNIEEPERNLHRMLTVLKDKGLLCSIGMFHFRKTFPHSFGPHSFRPHFFRPHSLSPHSFKTTTHDFVAPGPCKICFFPYQITKQHFFLAHPGVLKNYLLTMKNTCFKLKDW